MERRFMNGRFIRAAVGAVTAGRFINLVQGTLSVQGGTFICNYNSLTATDSVFTANHATQGGAVDQEWYATLTGDPFTRNAATPVAACTRCHTMVRDSVFARNTAGFQGGGIYNGLRHHGGHFPRFLPRELTGR
jgi:hypothetical protein